MGSKQISPHYGSGGTQLLLLLRASYWWLLRPTRLGTSTWANFLQSEGQLPPNSLLDLARSAAKVGRNYSWPSVHTHTHREERLGMLNSNKAFLSLSSETAKPLEFLLNQNDHVDCFIWSQVSNFKTDSSPGFALFPWVLILLTSRQFYKAPGS